MKIFYSILFFVTVAHIAEAQTTTLSSDTQTWSEGSIMTSDGKELKGLVRYDDKTGVLSYHDGENSRPLTAKSAVGFEFYDEALQKQRVFYSLEYTEEQQGNQVRFFFELVKDYKKFAILSKVDRLKVEERSSGGGMTANGGITPSTRYTMVSQNETIFIMNEDGAMEPYLEFVIVHDSRLNLLYQEKDPKRKGKIVDEEVLAKYIGDAHFKQLRHFARENDLKFKKKEDFLRILNYYDSIKDN